MLKLLKVELEDGTKTERHSSDSEPFSAFYHSKVMTDPFVGRLTFLRVYSGVITSGSYVLNSTNGKENVFQDWFRMYADQRLEESEVYAGDICAAVGLKDQLQVIHYATKSTYHLRKNDFPWNLLSQLLLNQKQKADQDKMGIASLQKLAEEDPSFRVKSDEETGQTIISGMGELPWTSSLTV